MTDEKQSRPRQESPDSMATAAKPGDQRASTVPDIGELLARMDLRDVHELNQAPIRGVVSDYGQIHSIDLPEGWVESDEKFFSGVGNRSFRMFHPPESPDTALCFYYRGLPISKAGGAAFAGVLKNPPRHLSLVELSSLAEVLRDMKEPRLFTIDDAYTEDVNGKRVLIIEGTYKQLQQTRVHMFVNADGSGRAVQEIYFQAAREQFDRHQQQARSALRSIIWKQPK